ncbi:A24 family peptidase [Oceanimonas baumannii]|uniref:A24 family peptidase n=1 Tax=Oceanimonas baumannii TaxID=129578 RepID=UPI003A94AFD7
MEAVATPLIISWLFLCAFQDVHQRRISNFLTLPVFIFSLIWLLWQGSTLSGEPAMQGATAALIAVALTLPGFLAGKMGAGDIKMMLAFALLAGPMPLLWAFVLAAVTMLLWRISSGHLWNLLPAQVRGYAWTLSPEQRHKLPYAPFIFLGAAICLPFS